MSLNISESIMNAYAKSVFMIKDKPLGNFAYHNKHSEIILDILNGQNSGRGMILHPGTQIAFFLAIAISTYNVFIKDLKNSNSFLEKLNYDDLVIYDDKRSRFIEIDNEGKVVIETIEKGNPCITRIPQPLFFKLKPYYGNAKTLDGRGVKRGSISKFTFLANLFNLSLNELKNTYEKSIVVVCEKVEADSFMESFRIRFENQTFSFCELFPCAYYTSSGEPVYYSGNSSKQNSLVKFVGNLSSARELIIEDKNVTTLLINGLKYFGNESSEINSIYNRKSPQSIVMMGELSKGINSMNYEVYENINVYGWTKNTMLKELSDINDSVRDYFSDDSKRLYCFVNNFVNQNVFISEIDNNLGEEVFFECKKALFRLSKSNVSKGINNFIIKGFSLLNLFQRSIFSIRIMDSLIISGKINALSPSSILKELQTELNQPNPEIENEMSYVVSTLSNMMNVFYSSNPKFEFLKGAIKNLDYRKSVAIVVPKNYYGHVFRESIPESFHGYINKKIDFLTPQNYNSQKLYDHVYFVGVFDWKILEPFALSNTRNINIIIYKNEKKLLNQARSFSDSNIKKLESISLIAPSEIFSTNEPKVIENDELCLSNELEILLNSDNTISTIKTVESNGNQNADIVRVAMLETGERVYFTKNYTPYVFDVENQVVSESNITTIKPGDTIIFTNHDSGTLDIVEKTMEKMIDENRFDDQFKKWYQKSKHWKRVLRDYTHLNNLSFKDLSDKMLELGISKHEVTLRTWLDEESHIVGPRDIDSYYIVARLTGDPDMLNDPDSYYFASKEVRSMRIRILRFIAVSIVRSYGKDKSLDDELFSNLSEDISRMSILVQLEKIVDTTNISVPSYLANRPVNI